MSESEFLAEWRSQLESGQSGLHLVGLVHPLDIFVGSNDVGNPKVTLQTKAKPQEPVLSGIVLVDRRQGTQGYWHLTLTLQDMRFKEVFLRLADDVFTRSESAGTEEQALRTVHGVFDEWRRLLSPRPLGVLTKEALRGLVGELWVLIHRFAQQRPMDEAIMGWLGPLNAHQDFWYDDSGLHEIKSIGPTMSAVKISSEYQLDSLGDDLELIVLAVGDVAEGAAGAVNLLTLVADVKEALEKVATSDDELQMRLVRLGVDLGQQYYADNWFLVSSEANYSVDDDFPAIRASTLPDGVERVTYRIGLGAIEPFKTAFKTIA